MKIKHLFYLALLLLVCACSSDLVDPQPTIREEAVRSNFIPMEKARQRLTQLMPVINGQISDNVNKIPFESRRILTGIALDKNMKPLTRGEAETQASCYVFRMDDDMFAIMSATTDQPELLAVGKGDPDFQDSTANMPDSSYWAVSPDIPDTGTVTNPGAGRFYRYERLSPTTIIHGNGGLCKVKWGNNSPFNDKLPFITEKNEVASAGCTAVAIAQMMTVDKLHGGYYREHSYDWSFLSQHRFAQDFIDVNSRTQVANLMSDINSEENLNPTFNFPVTEANIYNISRVWSNFHFSNSGKLRSVVDDSGTTDNITVRRSDFVSEVMQEIDNGYPILMMAWESGAGGHAWVCHGALEIQTPVLVYSESIYEDEPSYLVGSYVETAWYFQMNWGWDSQSDGYYLIKWDSTLDNTGAPDKPEIGEIATKGGYNCYNTNTIKIITGIRF